MSGPQKQKVPARAPEGPVQGLRPGILRAPAPEAPVQGLQYAIGNRQYARCKMQEARGKSQDARGKKEVDVNNKNKKKRFYQAIGNNLKLEVPWGR
jgi:hypothetical protein